MRKLKNMMSNILNRDDVVNETGLNKRNDGIDPLEKYKDVVKIKPLNMNEKVKTFEEYVDES